MSRLLLALIALVSTVSAQDLPAVTALPAADAITIDGELTEGPWQAGEWNSGFTVLDNPALAATHQTRFRVLYDAEGLYFGVELDEANIAGMRANATERDGKVHSDDCVEIMLDPTGERIEYYHFIVNSIGTLYDAQLRQGGHVRTLEWDCEAEAAAVVGEGVWTVELRVPVVELGLTTASTGDWALNVTRERYAEGSDLSSFVPITGGFHQPSLYASLTLAEADFGKYLWAVKEPYEARVMPDADGQLTYTAKTHLTNAGQEFRFIQLRAMLDESTGPWLKDGLDAGQAREYELSVPVETQGKQVLCLELADRRDPDVLLAVKSVLVDISYSPLTIDIVRPWYRDSIYATEDLKELVFDVAVALPEGQLDGLTLSATFSAGAPAEVLDRKSLAATEQPADASIRMKLPLRALADGDYTLTVSLVDEAAKLARHTGEKLVRKLPRVAHEWRLDERNVLLHNGEPVLPFGWFSIPAAAMDDPSHAYTLMQEYNAQYRSVEENREVLDGVVAAGTHVTQYPYPTNRMMTPSTVWGLPLTDEDAAALGERVAALSDHPGVFAWYMADEPELRPALPERCRRIFETVAEADPYHPCIMLNDTIAGIYKYVDGGDILMPDPYPCFIKGGLAAQPIEKVGEFIKAAVDAGGSRKAVWITPQAFNYGDYGKKNQRGPSFIELRNELYQAVVYGAKGFLWYTYSHTQNYPDIDLGMKWLSFEVQDLKEAILANADPELTVAVEAPRPEHIHASVRRVGDELVIIAVNTSTEAQTAKLTLDGDAVPTTLHVVSEGRAVELTGGNLTDEFATYATHIYTTDAALGGRESIDVPLEQIAAANAAREVPGNLAFEDGGASVEVSSQARYGSTPDRVLDGVTDGMRWTDGTPGELPDWLTVRWPELQTIRRVVVHTKSITDLAVQVPDGENWETVAESLGDDGTRIEVTLAEAVETPAIRILATVLKEGEELTSIWEVEAYAE